MTREDNTAEQLRELMRGLEIGPAAIVHLGPDGFYKIGRAIAEQAKANTRADSGEAVAWQFRNVTEEGPSPVWHDIDKSKFDVLRNDPHAEVRELFTQPRATAVDVRDADRYRWLREKNLSVVTWFERCWMPTDIDQAIDAALSQRVEK